MIKVAYIAALEREVKPLIRGWRVVDREYQGRRFRFFESDDAVVVGGGIGAEAARRATEAAISLYSPAAVWSVGFAGALHLGMRIGEAFRPSRVIDASDGSSVETGGGVGSLLSYGSIASAGQKRKLGSAYGAQAVDMEAAAVARGAQARGVRFAAYKVISDDVEFEIPAMERFIRNGRFRAFSFLGHILIRPWLWFRVIQLARNSARAAQALSRGLAQYNAQPESLEYKPAELHPMKRA